MSYALTTTKRKFHRILDSISNSSDIASPAKRHHSSASSTTLADSPAKKIRPIRPKSSCVVSTSTTLVEDDRRPRSSSDVKNSSPKNKTKPYFTPWDRDDFLERLKTFRHLYLWMSKPDKVNEVEWAKRGWRCVGQDRVACAGCHNEVVMKLEPEQIQTQEDDEENVSDEQEWRQAAQDELVEKYAEMIITEHDEDCLWRRRGCDATIQRLPLTHPTSTLDALRSRYMSFVNIDAELPNSLRMPESIDIEAISKRLSPLLLPQVSPQVPTETTAPATEINLLALKFALFGWEAETDSKLNLATCPACFRRLGLWLFTPRPNPTNPSESREAIVDRLDLVEEHRLYCPWISGASQSGTVVSKGDNVQSPEPAGWEMLLNAVRKVQHTDSDDGISDTAENLGSDSANRDTKDKERWAKLKKLKQAFRVKRVKKPKKDKVTGPRTAG